MTFATKPALARVMIGRAVSGGAAARWVAGDEVYGSDPGLRTGIARHGLGFVLAVAKDHPIGTAAGTRRAIGLAVCLPARCWQRMSASDGAKGSRLYDWAWIVTAGPALPADDQGVNWLLIRRSVRPGRDGKPGYAFYRAHAPAPVPLRALVQVAGTRWKIEEAFAGSKELAALDQHQVRTWTSWVRWTILAMSLHDVAAHRVDPLPDVCWSSRGGGRGRPLLECSARLPEVSFSTWLTAHRAWMEVI